MRALSSLGQKCRSHPSVRQSFFPFAQKARPLVRANDIRLLLRGCRAREPRGLSWLDLAKGRLPLDRLFRHGCGSTFFPWASPIPRGRQESLTAAILRCATARRRVRRRSPSACRSPSRPRWSRARAPRRNDMANIGTFKKSGQEFRGEIRTLSVQAKGAPIVPEANRANDNAPSHRVFVGRAEIGAAWSKRSNEGRDYLSVKLDDPSFTAPIYANLFDEAEGETFTLIWSLSWTISGPRPEQSGGAQANWGAVARGACAEQSHRHEAVAI